MSEKFNIPSELVAAEAWSKFTKRELLAGKILEQLVASDTSWQRPTDQSGVEHLANLAVNLSDALFKALYPEDSHESK